MSRWLSRLGSLIALVAIALAALPRDAEAHCRPAAGAVGHDHHATAPGPAPTDGKNTDSGQQCPHCPPAECRRHLQCAPAADAGVPESAAVPPPTAPPSVRARTPLVPLTPSHQPPTPPPQALR
ncbi:MAG: hypothetical protein IT352_08540 [Gemmatimonadales bacterium]|nr:hypothetical protein [Gemmatimonadales bacterium]